MFSIIKSINAPKGSGFWLEAVFMNEGKISILFSNDDDRNDLTEISIDWAIHFQRTDESYKINTFHEMVVPIHGNVNPLFVQGERFFEVIDKKYTKWVVEDHYFPLKDYEKLYVFFFMESYVEVISPEPPVFTKINSKQEYYENLKERVCWTPGE
jgi:identified by metaGeneAnnotator